MENGNMYPSEPIHNLQRMERKVLLALNEIKDIKIRQRHGLVNRKCEIKQIRIFWLDSRHIWLFSINRKYSHFLVNGDIAVLPISKKRFLRDGDGTIQHLDRVNGKY